MSFALCHGQQIFVLGVSMDDHGSVVWSLTTSTRFIRGTITGPVEFCSRSGPLSGPVSDTMTLSFLGVRVPHTTLRNRSVFWSQRNMLGSRRGCCRASDV